MEPLPEICSLIGRHAGPGKIAWYDDDALPTSRLG
jgi:hypothetical protein